MDPRVTSGQCICMSFGSEVMVTRFNRRKERVNTMTGISLTDSRIKNATNCDQWTHAPVKP